MVLLTTVLENTDAVTTGLRGSVRSFLRQLRQEENDGTILLTAIVRTKAQAAANFLSMATPEAGGFLLASPAVRRNQIHNAEFSTLLRARMGLPQVPGIGGPGQPKQLLCPISSEHIDHRIDPAGDHAMVCIKSRLALGARHDEARDALVSGLKRAVKDEGSALTIVKEPHLQTEAFWAPKDVAHGAGPAEDEEKRSWDRGDIMIMKKYDPLTAKILDVAVVHPGMVTHKEANRVRGSAAAARWSYKANQYLRRWGETTLSGAVVPIIIETGGRWDPEWFKFVKKFFVDMGTREATAAFKDMLTQTLVQLRWHCARIIRARPFGLPRSRRPRSVACRDSPPKPRGRPT